MKVLFRGLAAVIVTFCLAGSASAAIVTTTFKGVVTGGSDSTGVFGAKNSDLTGEAFSLVFTTDDTNAVYNSTAPDTRITEAAGGPLTTTGVLTIKGVSWSFNTGVSERDSWTSAFCCGGGEYVSVDNSNAFHAYSVSASIKFLSGGFNTTGDFHGPVQYTVAPGDTSDGNFSINNNSPVIQAYGNLQPTFFAIGPITAAPEPRAWALMMIATAAMGAALRSRHHRQSA